MMKLQSMSDDVFRQLAEEENSCMISAIGLDMLSQEQTKGLAATASEEHSNVIRLAFGTLVSFRRRAMKLTLEELAEKARVELEELFCIEEDPNYVPEPRTVHNLGHQLKLPVPQLLVLSGNATSQNAQLDKAALKFAARSRAVEKLNSEQKDALNEFVKVLVDQAIGKKSL
jgi:hypothetical protein